MDARSVEHKATASCISSLLNEGETDWVLRRGSPGLHWNLSSDCVRGRWARKRKGRRREWKGSSGARGGLIGCFCRGIGCVCGWVGWVSGWRGTCSWVGDWSCWGCCWGWNLDVNLQSFLAWPSPLSLLLFRLREGSIGVLLLSEVWLSLDLGLGDVAFLGVAAGLVFGITVDEVEGFSAEGVLWVTGEGVGGFLVLDGGVLSLGVGAFGGSPPFFLLLRVTRVHSSLVSPSGVALVVSMVLVVLMELVVVVSASLGRCTVSVAFWEQTFVRWPTYLHFQTRGRLPSTTTNIGLSRGVMVIVVGKWTRRHEFKSWTRLKGMNPIILPPAMGK